LENIRKNKMALLSKHITQNDGTRVYYSHMKGRIGSPTVVFIHGWVMNHTAWEMTQAFLYAKGYSTLTFDIRGHGMSKSRTMNFNKVVDDMKKIIDREKIRDAVLVGYSMGGMIAQKYYLKHKRDVSGLALINTTYTNPVKELPIFNVKLMKYLAKNILTTLKKEEKRYFVKAMLRILSNNNALFKKSYQKISSYLRPRFKTRMAYDYLYFPRLKGTSDVPVFYEGLIRTGLNSADSFYKEKVKFTTEKQLHKIQVPTLIVSSKYDSVMPAGSSKIMHSKIKNSSLHILQRSDHLSILQETEKIGELINEFLKTVRKY
jgi:pimeloyl-ACP methyl ester carboxylesterase